MKRAEKAVSYVIYSMNRKKILAVKRPHDDEELPDVWGLPASGLKKGETFEAALVRSGKEKLGVRLRPKKPINAGKTERPLYILYMKLYEASIARGKPSVPQHFSGTQYVAWKWAEPCELEEAASKGSLCTRLFLDFLKTGNKKVMKG